MKALVRMPPSSPRVPFAWPRWITSTRVATVIVAMTASASTTLLTAWIPAPDPAWRLLLISVGALISSLFARWVCRVDRPNDAVYKTVLRTVGAGSLHACVMGGLVVPLFILISQSTEDGRSPNDGGLFFAFAIGSLIVGAPFGAAVGLAYSVLPAIAAKTRLKPSHTDVDYLALAGGLWLMAIAAFHWIGTMIAGATELAPFVAFPLFGLGGLLLVLNAVRASLITRFVDRLRAEATSAAKSGAGAGAGAGDGAGELRIVPRSRVRVDPAAVMPLMHGCDSDACQSVLLRVGEPPREVLYRDAALPEAEDRVVALLP